MNKEIISNVYEACISPSYIVEILGSEFSDFGLWFKEKFRNKCVTNVYIKLYHVNIEKYEDLADILHDTLLDLLRLSGFNRLSHKSKIEILQTIHDNNYDQDVFNEKREMARFYEFSEECKDKNIKRRNIMNPSVRDNFIIASTTKFRGSAFNEYSHYISKVAMAIFKCEGVYSCHSNDKGGETVFGITRKYNPEMGFWCKIDDYCSKNNIVNRHNSRKRISDFANNEILSKFSLEIADKYLSYFPINEGHLAKLKELHCNEEEIQRVIGMIFFISFNASIMRARKIFDNSVQKAIVKKERFADTLYTSIKDFYTGIVEKDPTQQIFIKGWFKRLDESNNINYIKSF